MPIINNPHVASVTPIVRDRPSGGKLLTPAELARIFNVDAKTVSRWAKAGKLTSIRTLGGHRRFFESEVLVLLSEGRQERTP